MYAALPEQIREIDRIAAERGLTPLCLMGRAGRAVAREVVRRVRWGGRVLIAAGGGNNGGDGYAAAQYLSRLGMRVSVWDVFGTGQRTSEGQYYRRAAQEAGAVFVEGPESGVRYDAVVDAVFGVGYHQPLPPPAIVVADTLASLSGLRIAVDVPMGVDPGTGTVSPHACRADVTIVLTCMKPGLMAYPGRGFCGEFITEDLGIPLDVIAPQCGMNLCILTDREAGALLPARAPDAHKGDCGRVFLRCGSRAYRGAALLAAAAAVRCGAGFVTLAAPQEVIGHAVGALPEVLYSPVDSDECEGMRGRETLVRKTAGQSAVLVGCGCGVSPGLRTLVTDLLVTPGCPLVLDADALNVLAQVPGGAAACLAEAQRQVILTPHPVEFSRLSGLAVDQIAADRLGCALDFARQSHAVVLLKGPATVIAAPDGKAYLNPTGNEGMAKAGSGDALAGMLAAFCAQGCEPVHAAALAAYVHGRAGELLSRTCSVYGVRPRDLPDEAARVLASLPRF